MFSRVSNLLESGNLHDGFLHPTGTRSKAGNLELLELSHAENVELLHSSVPNYIPGSKHSGSWQEKGFV